MKIKSLFVVIFISAFFYSDFSNAQENDSTSQSFVQKNFSISGEVGAYGELYSMEGQPKRRPSSTGRIFFRPTLNLFGVFQIPFEFLLSTEGSSARQNINQFGINPKWEWGSLHAGDFTEDYSQFTLSGIKIRGGGLNLTPGNFRFSTAAGFTQRSVQGGAQDGSFKRFLLAAKLGYGNEQSSFIDFIFLRAKDEIGSASPNQRTITVISPNGNDVFEIGSLQSIRWNSYNIDGAVKIELSRDGGNTFEFIADNQPNVGFYNWTVSGAATFQAIVRVSSNNYPDIFDVSDFVFTIGSGVQSFIASNLTEIVNPYAVTPQENLVFGTKGKVAVFNNIVNLEFDGAGSIYSRDLRAEELELDSTDFPNFLTKLYKPRAGTNYDLALSSVLSFNFQSVNTKLGFKHIGPGYNSLGTAYLLNDIREYSILNSIRIANVGFMLGYFRQNDNLLDQKTFTTSRNSFILGMNAMLTSIWSSNISFNFMNMKNDSNNDSTKTDFGSISLSTNQSFIVSPQGFLKSVNLNYAYQNTDNKSYLLKNSKTNVHTANIGATFSLFENLFSTLSLGFINSSVFDSIKTFTHNYSIQFQHSELSNKLITTLGINSAFNEDNTTIRVVISSGYQIAQTDNISIMFSFMKFNGVTSLGGKFNELVGSINYSHTL